MLRGPQQAMWLDRLADEHANLHAALAVMFAAQQNGVAAKLGIALWRYWYVRGHYAEGWHWLQKLLARVDQPELRAKLFWSGDVSTATERHRCGC